MSKIPRIILSTIVKNELGNLPKLFDSLVGAVDGVVIADTGSTDGSVEYARSRGANVIEVPWTGDFAEARNQALDAADGEFILHLDADEHLLPEDAGKIKRLAFESADAFTFALYEETGEFLSIYTRLFRKLPDLRYTGRVHESLTLSPKHRVKTTDIKIIHTGYSGDQISRKEKEARNRALLERSLSEEPNNYLVNFLAAREYDRIGDERALPLYDKALRLGEGKLGPDFYKLYATLLARSGESDRALKVIQKGIKQFALYPDLHFLQGMVLLDRGQFEQARQTLSTCLQLIEKSGNATGIDLEAFWRTMRMAEAGRS